jgi:hypothetical protein
MDRTTSNGTGGQLQTEWLVNIDRNTHYFSLPEKDRGIYQLTNPVPVDWERYVRGYDQALI